MCSIKIEGCIVLETDSSLMQLVSSVQSSSTASACDRAMEAFGRWPLCFKVICMSKSGSAQKPPGCGPGRVEFH
jgi:hypothetical protein